jgi:hypothetical protein
MVLLLVILEFPATNAAKPSKARPTAAWLPVIHISRAGRLASSRR